MQEAATPSDHEVWLQTIEQGLALSPTAVPLLFERAKTLDALDHEHAEAAYRTVIEHEPSHFAAWNDLGMLLVRRGEYSEALVCFRNAVEAKPELAIGHANLAYLLHRGSELEAAKRAYLEALRLDPQNIEAHRGLSIALSALGEEESAREHREKGFAASPLTTLSYRGSDQPVPLLLLVSESAANVPLERLIDLRTFLIHKLVVEFAHHLVTLPEHVLIVNAVGDVDACADALVAARNIVLRSAAPVINHPDTVAETGRIENALRLGKLAGIRTPRLRRIARQHLLGLQAEKYLADLNLRFPLLLRSFGYHTGEHFLRVDTPAALTFSVNQLPGKDLLAMEYLDLRDEHETYTKYRMMIVGDAMYPLHAAISHDWKVHYFSAAMKEEAAYREFDANFLEDPIHVIGQQAIYHLATIAHMLALDYGGIDFALDHNNQLVVFEANATMVIPRPGANPMWDYRRRAVSNITNAVHLLLLERAQRARLEISQESEILISNNF